MIDHGDLHIALRTRLLGVIVCTTGATALAATSTGYTRTTGSFLTDGFRVGMEITPSGFSDLTPRVIRSVSALAIGTSGSPTPQDAASGRTLDAALPVRRAYDNDAFTPTAGALHLEEEFVPATSTLISASADGGTLEEAGLYILRVVGLADTGHLAIRAMTNALLARYTPGTSMVVDGGRAYVRGDTAPSAGPIRRRDGGWAVSTCTIPWRAYSTNAIAA